MGKCAIISVLAIALAAFSAQAKEAEEMAGFIHWLGHDSFRLDAEKTIYIDPFQLDDGAKKADIILVTHEHRDHCSPDDIAKISGPDTLIVLPPDCAAKAGLKRQILAKPGDVIDADGIKVEAVRAYNTNKKFHPKEKNWVGYIVTAKGKRVYHAGDTDRIPEMKEIKCDIAMLPVSGTYVMTASEAVEAALDIKPALAIPMHYASIVGTEEDARKFAEGLKGKVKTEILPKER